MSKISNLIFKNAKHYITSPYGKRSTISTAAGNTSTLHSGTDYGTNNTKLAQYAIESGTVLSCGTASDGAKYVWVKYPRINKKFLHYHLDSIAVKTGQKVEKGTKLGTTGKTGKATGIHLHLGIKDLSTDKYEDPEAFSKTYKEPVKEVVKTNYLPKYTGKSISLVDALKAVKVDSSFSYRKKVATANNIKLYAGTANQNTQLLALLKQGKAVKP